MRKTFFAAAAAFAVASGAMTIQATAADLQFAPPPPVFVPTWAGFYIGGHIGYGEGTADFRTDLDFAVGDVLVDTNTERSYFNPNGLIGGVQGGYNWQVNSLVFGIEGDVSFADWDESGNVFDSDFDTVNGLPAGEYAYADASADIDMLASIRGRLGYAFGSMMLYGTGGVAWADAEASATIVASDPGLATETVWSGQDDISAFGVVAGGGMAWMVIPQTFSVGFEGLYYWFDEKETLIDDTIAYANGEVDVRATAEIHDAWVLRARADFHF